jgi:16S rRNA (guanine(966)-N(2))-methyltransferase RsmD
MPYLPGNSVLDLFAGSGAMGVEALSRGSAHAVFVECDKSAVNVTRQNIELAKVADRAEIIFGDSLGYLDRTKSQFDIIFLDPPYNTGLLTKSIKKISEKNLLSEGGIIVAESEHLGEEPDDSYFDIIKRAKYGKTTVFVLR